MSRNASRHCGREQCRLLQPPEVMGGGGGGGGGGGDCLLLDFDTGELVSMRSRILEAS